MGQAGVKSVCMVRGIGRGWKQDDGTFEDALKIRARHLTDGVSVRVHFVDVFAHGNPHAIAILAAVFGVKSVEGAWVAGLCSVNLNDDIRAQIVREGASGRSGIGRVVQATDMTWAAPKVDRRGFALRWGHAQAALGEAKEVAVRGRNKSEVAQGLDEGKVNPVFVEHMRIPRGQVKRPTHAWGEGAVEGADQGECRLVTRIEMPGYGIAAPRRG